jgi:hypothetical protein
LPENIDVQKSRKLPDPISRVRPQNAVIRQLEKMIQRSKRAVRTGG